MNYKSLLLILLIVVLVVVLTYNRRELFQDDTTKSENVFCDGENDVKYVIFYPSSSEKVRANAKAIACNVKEYDSNSKMFRFKRAENSSIAVEMGDAYELTLVCKIKGSGPVFTGNSWKVSSSSDKIILQIESQTFMIHRKSDETKIELSYDSFSNNLVLFRIDDDDSKIIELNSQSSLQFSRFDIGKSGNTHFDGFIGDIVVLEKKIGSEQLTTPASTTPSSTTPASTVGATPPEDNANATFDRLLNFLLQIDPESFKNYNREIEHFQSSMQRPTNFNTIKIKETDENELKFLENMVEQSFGDYEASADQSNAVKLSKVLIYLGLKFIKSAVSKKMAEYSNLASVIDVPKLNCRDTEVLKACFYYNDSIPIPAFKFTNNPIDGMVSIKSKLESFISQALTSSLVKDYLNSSPEKIAILNDIKAKINETLSLLNNRYSDAFFIYFELDFTVSANDYNFYLRRVKNSAPDVYMGEDTPQTTTPASGPTSPTTPTTTARPTPAPTTTVGELYPPETIPPRVLKCNFNAYGETELGCVKTCLSNQNINNCDPETCINICEKCDDKSYCRWLQDKTQYQESQACQFDANVDNTTSTEFECINLCNQTGNENCSQNVCKNLCQRCSNEENCPWVREEREFSADIQNIDYPSAPIVTGIPGDKKITLKWTVNSTGGSPIEKFIFMIFKTKNHNEGMRVEVAHNNIENVSGEHYSHTIETLENNVNYTVSLAAVNKRGLSSMSKPLVLKPFIYDEEVIINNTLDTSNIIQMERDKLVEEIMKKIENKNYNNLSNEISEVSRIEESLKESRSKKTDLFSQLKKIGRVVLSA